LGVVEATALEALVGRVSEIPGFDLVDLVAEFYFSSRR